MCGWRPRPLCCDAIYGKRESAAFSEEGATTLHPCRGRRFRAGQSHSKPTFHDTSFSFHVWFQSQTTILFSFFLELCKYLVLPCLRNTQVLIMQKIEIKIHHFCTVLYWLLPSCTVLYWLLPSCTVLGMLVILDNDVSMWGVEALGAY